MKSLERLVAEKLIKISAVKLQPSNSFTWASGWKSPIYTDNRKTLSYPALRSFIKIELCRLIMEKYENVDAIAGVATGAIAQGALVADELGLPYVYVRSTPKDQRKFDSGTTGRGHRRFDLYRRKQPQSCRSHT